MKKIYISMSLIVYALNLNAQAINFSDANFKSKLLEANATNTIAKNLSGIYFNIDTNTNGEIEQSEALQVSSLNVSGSNISSVVGLSYFINLQTFNCESNNLINLEVSNLVNLRNLGCSSNNLQFLDVTNNHNLFSLYCVGNNLSSLNLNECPIFFALICNYNNLTSLYLRNGSQEQQLFFSNNPNLSSVCGDDNELIGLQGLVNYYGYTNCLVSSICSLSTNNFEFSDYFSLYPNPVRSLLNIQTKNNIQISSLSIYNTLGQLLLVVPDATSAIDVSSLNSGTYFIKVNSDKGIANSKFIKQ